MNLSCIEPLAIEWQIILNPNADAKSCSRYRQDIENYLKQHHVAYRLYLSEGSHEAGKEIVRELCKKGERHFLIVGGDGTLNKIVNGIFDSGVPSREVYLALLPLGTGNDWARSLNYSKHLFNNLDSFLAGRYLLHDIGKVCTLPSGQVRYFINIAGFCFDAEVIYYSKLLNSRFYKSNIYLAGLLKALFKHKNQQVCIHSDGQKHQDKTFSIAVGIGQYNGNGMRQVPMAEPDDGLFDVVVIRKVSLPKVILNVKRLFSGTHVRLKEVKHFRSDFLEIQSSKAVLGEVEGELLPMGNYRIEMLPRALHVLLPTQKPLP